ncbi:MAG TPA: Asp-tRNA(Asn)/Glu-tRNA(Gln) amidotransferase subunit GatA [Candidatus Onthenecus intestinigallinarum]|uniref:Glutamyl-tRNA(Gln) amidotransferase subunit A n=1 Tax=Candidatus Onthenecus intestinigallinarum TaxID=2840875 RepID=A0A9D0ZD89_9FIRM|nr:Asp-tRNA(Asn)/Glu-tRNA(Gln) amidotransferase subunit GatA [Candidatus Onthenecus intestinigallinarum]
MQLTDLTALELGAAIKSRACSAEEAVRASLARIAALDGRIGAFITVCEQEALQEARRVQRGIDDGSLTHPLAGVPMALKDNLSTRGVRTTCGSRMLERYVPTFDATVVERLRALGAVCVGKTNMDEFAMGSSTETSYFHPTRNPFDPARVPGGSSGGSAAAVAAREVPYALGSDTGGSIRQPASFCGVTGLKPTYGAVSRYGLIAYASSLDQIGPLCRDALDAAAVHAAIAGADARDATSVQAPTLPPLGAPDLAGLCVGIPEEYLGEGLDPQVRARVLDCAQTLRELGAQVEPCSMPALRAAIPAYYVLASAEASSNLSRYDGIKYGYRAAPLPDGEEDLTGLYARTRSEGFGREVKRRVLLGTFALCSGYYDAYYAKAQRARALIRASFDEALARFDALLGPTAPTAAFPLGERLDDPLQMYLGDIYTVSVNLAGLPGLSIPCGADAQGLPVGAQLIAAPFGEGTLLRIAAAYQAATGHHRRAPKEVG